MKTKASIILAAAMLAASLTGCNDVKNDVIDNMVYISEGSTDSPTAEIILGDNGATSSSKFSVNLGRPVATDTKVRLELNASALADFNKRNSTEFVMIPADCISFPAEVTIPAGQASVTVPVEVRSFEGEKGVEYAAAFAIADAGGQLISKGSGCYTLTFGKPLTQKAPTFYYTNKAAITWPGEVELSNFTLEWWARVTNRAGNGGFSVNNQALFAFNANYELYIRFGDVVYTVNGKNVYNFLQIKTMGIDANYDSGDPNKNPLQWGEWIHFAHTYDAATGDVVLYMNGKEVNRNNGGAGNVFKFSGCTMFGSGSTYFKDYIEMCQLRMWKTTRTPAQIAKYMKKEVKYTDPNLLFYVPMNEGEGSVLHDVTGNGFDINIGSGEGATQTEAQKWTEYTWK